MRYVATLIAMLASTSGVAQTTVPRQLGLPDGGNLGRSWQLVSQPDGQCTLDHVDDHSRVDLRLGMAVNAPTVSVVLPLNGKAASPDSIELSFHRADPILLGSRTFVPAQGSAGAELRAELPPGFVDAITGLTRLSVYDMNDHLFRAVALGGVSQAVAGFHDCMRQAAAAEAARKPADPVSPARVADRGWKLEHEHGNCLIERRSTNGALLVLALTREPTLIMTLTLGVGYHVASGTTVPVTLTLGNPSYQEMGSTARLHASNGPHGLLIFGGLDPRFLLDLRRTDWTELVVETQAGSVFDIREVVKTNGAEAATVALVLSV